MIAKFLRQAARWGTALAVAIGAGHAQAKIEGIGDLVSSTPAFDLIAADGHISAADGVQIYMWGFGVYSGNVSLPGNMQYVGPTLKVKQGDSVTVTLRNFLPTKTSMIFGGQVVTASGGSAGPLAQEAGPTETVTYTFTASQPGTYLYQSGTQTALQVEMGMVGVLIVYPNAAATCPTASGPSTKCAYAHNGSAYERETLVVATEADSVLHQAVYEQVQAAPASCRTTSAGCMFAANLAGRFPDYWFMNGRTGPDTMAGNFVGELALQPYNTLPRMHPGERMLLRIVGAGSDLHPMHHHGNNSWGIARDGRMLASTASSGPNLAVSDYTVDAIPGQTYDAIWSWTGAGIGWDIYGASCGAGAVTANNCRFGRYTATGAQTALAACRNPGDPYATCTDRYVSSQSPLTDMYKPIPVKLPSQFELAYGEFYSGSPYLGDLGALPVGASSLANLSGGFFHMFHSHAEKEIINGGVFPGGMMTMIVIEPAGVVIEPAQP